jgi:hypothetical protein
LLGSEILPGELVVEADPNIAALLEVLRDSMSLILATAALASASKTSAFLP